MKPEDLTEEEQRVAKRFRVICNEQIESLEDKLPAVTHPLEKDGILKEIDALLDLVDQANERAVELVRIYNEEKNNG
jgi:uncharacterized protein YpiB (UPF0302 family)|tara:strand:+ start:480 stop:710 length:231 start_codon:yes stop_codon:yes gene_type:complete